MTITRNNSPKRWLASPKPGLLWDRLRQLLSLLLLSSAALKLHTLSTRSIDPTYPFASPSLYVAVTNVEMVLGILLAFRLYPTLTWLFSLLLFSILSIASLSMALTHQQSCGCFGVLKVNPWYTLCLDIIVVSALSLARPPKSPAAPDTQTKPSLHSAIIPGVGLALLMSLGVAFLINMPIPTSTLAILRGEPLIVDPPITNLGDVSTNTDVDFKVDLKNLTNQTVTITGGTADCSCLACQDLPVRIPGNQSRSITVRLSTGKHPGHLRRAFKFYTDASNQFDVFARVMATAVDQMSD